MVNLRGAPSDPTVISHPGGVSVNHIARWNGTSWQPLGTGLNSTVRALAVFDGRLIAAGQFTTAGGQPANHVASWNGSSWQAMDSGMDSPVFSLGIYNSGLHAGGLFNSASSQAVGRIAYWKFCPHCPGTDGSGTVNIDDLVTVITSWGTCGSPCPADVAPGSGDGVVNIDDLVQVITAWGACN